MDKQDVVIVGAGPAGLFCAATLAKTFRGSILLLEKNPSLGRKLLLSGGGHCNFTHVGSLDELQKHFGANGSFLRPALRAFSNQDLIRFFRSQGVSESTDETGRITPRSGRAQDVLDALLRQVSQGAVELRTDEPVLGLARSPDERIELLTRQGSISAKAVVVACGGKSYAHTGSSGDGYGWAQALGHAVVPLRPALTPLVCHQNPSIEALAGLSLWDSQVSLWKQGRRQLTVAGDILFTHRGLSGPAILDLSRFVDPNDRLTLRLLPTTKQQLEPRLLSLWSAAGAKAVRTLLRELGLSQRLADAVLGKLLLDAAEKVARLSRKQRNAIQNLILDFPVVISERAGFEMAMVTQGGVALSQVDPKSMGSRLVLGLFFAGEVLDVDGDCGGYNLQAAFSTGFLAAKGVSSFLKDCDNTLDSVRTKTA